MAEPDVPAAAQGRAHFDRAREAADAGDFDRAIDAYLNGLRLLPDDVSGGHIELRVVALQRSERGGAKPTPEEVKERLTAGGSPLDKMLNAEYLLAKDPEHLAYASSILRSNGPWRTAALILTPFVYSHLVYSVVLINKKGSL